MPVSLPVPRQAPTLAALEQQLEAVLAARPWDQAKLAPSLARDLLALLRAEKARGDELARAIVSLERRVIRLERPTAPPGA